MESVLSPPHQWSLNFSLHHSHLGYLVSHRALVSTPRVEVLIDRSGVAGAFAFLTCSWVMLMLLFQGPYTGNHCPTPHCLPEHFTVFQSQAVSKSKGLFVNKSIYLSINIWGHQITHGFRILFCGISISVQHSEFCLSGALPPLSRALDLSMKGQCFCALFFPSLL